MCKYIICLLICITFGSCEEPKYRSKESEIMNELNVLGTKFLLFTISKNSQQDFEISNSEKIRVIKSDTLEQGYIFDYNLSTNYSKSVYSNQEKIAYKFLDNFLYFNNSTSEIQLMYEALPVTYTGMSYNTLGLEFHNKCPHLVDNLAEIIGETPTIGTIDSYLSKLSQEDKFLFMDTNMLSIIFIVGEQLRENHPILKWDYLPVFKNKIWIPVLNWEGDVVNVTDFCIDKFLFEHHKQIEMKKFYNSLEFIINNRYKI